MSPHWLFDAERRSHITNRRFLTGIKKILVARNTKSGDGDGQLTANFRATLARQIVAHVHDAEIEIGEGPDRRRESSAH